MMFSFLQGLFSFNITNDFTLYFWSIGRAVLEGHDPYTVFQNIYPPASCMVFSIFGLLPQQVSFILWVFVNLFIFFTMVIKKKEGVRSYAWLAYTPFLFVLISGQIDFFLFWLSTFLDRDKWYVPIFAALITLKPQIALIVLPVFLLDWLLHQRKLLIRWLVFSIILQGFPLLIDPGLYSRWWTLMFGRLGEYQTGSPGLFSLTVFGIPAIILGVIALAIFIYGLTQGKAFSIQANLLVLPFGLWYNSVFLMGISPWQWMVPVSWIATVLAVIVKGVYPFALIPLTAFALATREIIKTRQARAQLDSS
jgi:hypothetical protein